MSVQTWEDALAIEDIYSAPDIPSVASAAIQSQYAHSAQVHGFAAAARAGIDATSDIERFRASIADPETAFGTFLDDWGRRIGVDRYIKIKATGKLFRFDDDYFRFLINYRALCNIANATASTANSLLSMLTSTTTFVVDYQDMTINSIVIIGAIPDLQSSIIAQYGLLNRPAGVKTNLLVIYPDEQIFGFDGSKLHPFNQGVFNPGREIQLG